MKVGIFLMEVCRGVTVNSLSRTKQWKYQPANDVKVGDAISGGQIYGVVYENSLIT